MTENYTQMLINLSEIKGFNDQTLETILNNKEFEKNYYKIQKHADGLYSLLIYSEERKFEKYRNKIIERISYFSESISIVYDSITQNYLSLMGNEMYELEKRLRNLIELVFLKKEKENWFKYFSIEKKHDRKNNRGTPFTYLNNYLDELDFIQLEHFLKNEITMINKSLKAEMSLIGESILNINFSNPLDLIQSKEEIMQKVADLISSNNKNVNDNISHKNYYEHLSPRIAEEWKKLYTLRNYWAHNTFLISTEEYREFDKLSKSVTKSVLIEMTILCLFKNNENEVSFGGQSLDGQNDNFKIVLHKTTFESEAIIHISGNFKDDEEKRTSFKKNDVTYFDLLKLFEEILKFNEDFKQIKYMNQLFNLSLMMTDEFFNLAENVVSIFNSLDETKESKEKLLNIKEYLKANGFQVDNDQTTVKTTEDIDRFLKEINTYIKNEIDNKN